MVSSADVVRWSGEVEGEVRRVPLHVEEISGSLSALQDTVATCSSQYSHLEIVLQQLVGNHAARSDASRDRGDVRERLMHKSQLIDDAALWKNTSSRRHWLIRGRIPPAISESPADIQAFVEESVNVTARVADQLRSLNGFDVALFGPRSDVPVGDSIMITECLELLRSAIAAVFFRRAFFRCQR